jgi:hypothetical protein
MARVILDGVSVSFPVFNANAKSLRHQSSTSAAAASSARTCGGT